LRVPESLYERTKELAQYDGVSLNQYVQLALAEKVSREQVLDMMEGRFNELKQELIIAILEKQFQVDELLKEELKRFNHRYTLFKGSPVRPHNPGRRLLHPAGAVGACCPRRAAGHRSPLLE
jgi:hypothetical protein